MENAGAFLHLLLAQKIVYEEDALKAFNKLLTNAKKRNVKDSDELMELLSEHHHSLSKYGFQVKLLHDPLGRTENRSGMFYALVNTEKDTAIQAAMVLKTRKEAMFFNAVLRHLLYEYDADEEEEFSSTVIGRILPMSMLRNPDFLRNIDPDENPLLPRDVERIVLLLDREKWIRMTKMSGRPGQLEDTRQRGVWFGPRAIAEFPQISNELRQRNLQGPRKQRSALPEPVPREEVIMSAVTEVEVASARPRGGKRHLSDAHGGIRKKSRLLERRLPR